MHEIIHLSFGTLPNHTHSHFYDSQASYFVFNNADAAKSAVNPHVLFSQGKAYTPRALIFDMKGGFGGLGKSNTVYDDSYDSNLASWGHKDVETIAQVPVKKSAYRQWAEGTGQDFQKLDASNTLYWSDYLSVLYHPKSMLAIPNWQYDPVKYPSGRHRGASDGDTQAFEGYQTGFGEYDEMNSDKEFLELHFRPIMEQCDNVSGISISTESDSAWSGVSAAVLQELRDEYYARGSIITWGLQKSAAPKKSDTASRILTTVNFHEYSSLYIPMAHGESSNNWVKGALFNVPFESLSLLSSLRNDRRVSMDSIVSSITQGSDRRLIDKITVSSGKNTLNFGGFNSFESPKTLHTFSALFVNRPAYQAQTGLSLAPGTIMDVKDPWALLNSQNLKISESESVTSRGLIESGTSEKAICEIECPQPFNSELPTYPQDIGIDEKNELDVKFQSTINVKYELKKMLQYSRNMFRGDEREDMIQTLGEMAEQYEFGYSDDDTD